jgi:antirestriction protein ArdC
MVAVSTAKGDNHVQKSSSSKFDVHQEITNRIVDALENAGEFQLPWITNKAGNFARPVNVYRASPITA